jgi:hypothetical protein
MEYRLQYTILGTEGCSPGQVRPVSTGGIHVLAASSDLDAVSKAESYFRRTGLHACDITLRKIVVPEVTERVDIPFTEVWGNRSTHGGRLE